MTVRRQLYWAVLQEKKATAMLDYHLYVFGDELARRQGYKEHDGMDAVYFYIAGKYNLPPAQVRGMSTDDLRFLVAEEMHGWTLPKEAIFEDH